MTLPRPNMITDCVYGLNKARDKNANVTVRSQGYVIYIYSLKQTDFTKAEVRDLKAHNWTFNKEYNMTFDTVG